jgi:hypothetical protein
MNASQIPAKQPAPWNRGRLIGQKAPLKPNTPAARLSDQGPSPV